MDIQYEIPTNRGMVNILFGLSVLLKYDPGTYFAVDYYFPTFELCANVLPQDLTAKELEDMTICDWEWFNNDDDPYWRYDFSARYRNN